MERKQKEFFIYVVLRAGKFFKVFIFLQKKNRCGAKGLSISCYQAVAAFFNMPREDHIFG